MPPHFHAKYAEFEVLIEIKTLTIYAGFLPNKQFQRVLKWAQENQDSLLAAFEKLNPQTR